MSIPLFRKNFQDTYEAVRLYLSTGAITAHLLRPEVHLAWERSHVLGANARLMKAESLSPLETERLLEREQALIQTAAPYIKMLSKAAGVERHAVMLGNPEAVVLAVRGDELSIQGPEAVPNPGALLSEAVSGANGIATPLANNDYTELIGPEHFIVGFHSFSCQGIPLRSFTGESLGVLSISVRRIEVGRRLKEILLCASYGIESELMLKHLKKQVQHVLKADSGDVLLEKLQQDMIQLLGAGRLRLEMGSRLLGKAETESAPAVLEVAQELIQEFQHRAKLWLDLASEEVGVVQFFSLTDVIRELVELLRTEAKISQVEVILDFREWIDVFADKKSLLRALLRCLVNAFQMVGSGGVIRVTVELLSQLEIARVFLSLLPAESQVNHLPPPLTLDIPVKNPGI